MSLQSNISAYRDELERLVIQGEDMLNDLHLREETRNNTLDEKYKELERLLNGRFDTEYQLWYTEAGSVVRQLLPDRIDEFIELYQGDGKRKEIDQLTYNIKDWMSGIKAREDIAGKKSFNDCTVIMMKFGIQLQILESVKTRFNSSLLNIKQIVQADLFDTELETAQELLKHGFGRGGGAVAGVVLEKHLLEVITNHNKKLRKKKPTINDYNDLLKNDGVIEVPIWRQIQRLADIRNLCVHNKRKAPTNDEVAELISGVEKMTKTLF